MRRGFRGSTGGSGGEPALAGQATNSLGPSAGGPAGVVWFPPSCLLFPLQAVLKRCASVRACEKCVCACECVRVCGRGRAWRERDGGSDRERERGAGGERGGVVSNNGNAIMPDWDIPLATISPCSLNCCISRSLHVIMREHILLAIDAHTSYTVLKTRIVQCCSGKTIKLRKRNETQYINRFRLPTEDRTLHMSSFKG